MVLLNRMCSVYLCGLCLHETDCFDALRINNQQFGIYNL
nr:MAG TPA: hypothetical protein [Caudoviricetes sp.]